MIPLGPVVARARLQATRAAAWVYLADADRRAEWWPELRLEPQVGGAIGERWSEDTGETSVSRDASGTVDVWVDGHAIGFTWREAGDQRDTAVLLTLRSQGDETGITVTETGFDGLPDSAARAAGSQDGWQVLLRDLSLAVTAAAESGTLPAGADHGAPGQGVAGQVAPEQAEAEQAAAGHAVTAPGASGYAAAEQIASEQAAADQAAPDRAHPVAEPGPVEPGVADQGAPDHAAAEQAVPEQAVPEQVASDQAVAGHAAPDQSAEALSAEPGAASGPVANQSGEEPAPDAVTDATPAEREAGNSDLANPDALTADAATPDAATSGEDDLTGMGDDLNDTVRIERLPAAPAPAATEPDPASAEAVDDRPALDFDALIRGDQPEQR